MEVGRDHVCMLEALSFLKELKKDLIKSSKMDSSNLSWSVWYKMYLDDKEGKAMTTKKRQILSVIASFGQVIGKHLIQQFNERFDCNFWSDMHLRFRWYSAGKFDEMSLYEFRSSMVASIRYFMNVYCIKDVKIQNIDFPGLYKMVLKGDYETDEHGLWDSLISSLWCPELVSLVDAYRAISPSIAAVERHHKVKHQYQKKNYSSNALEFVMFINQNAPPFGSSSYFKVVRNAVQYAVLLSSKKYRQALESMVSDAYD